MNKQRSIETLVATAALALLVGLPARAQLPAGFTARDIGDPAIAGSTKYDTATGKWTVRGSGGDLWGTDNDHFHFVAQSVTGDGMITARMLSTTGGHLDDGWEKTGVMIRETDAQSSPMAHTEMTFRAGIFWHWRETDSGDPHDNEQVGPRKFPVTMRTQRVGNLFSGFISFDDGKLWQNIGNSTLTMGDKANFGLCVMSHDDGILDTVEFDNVSVAPGVVSIAGVSAVGNDKGVLLKWNSVKDAVSYNVYRGPAGGAATLDAVSGDTLGLAKISPDGMKETSFTDNSDTLVPGQRQFYAVAAVAAAGEGPRVAVRAGRTGGQPVPNFTDVSIGAENVPNPTDVGSEVDAAGLITVRGAGPDIGGSSDDGFHFLYQKFDGNFRVTTKVVTKVFHTANSAKGGLMIREELTTGARNAFLATTGSHGVQFQSRTEKDGDTDASSDPVLGTTSDSDGAFGQLLQALAKGPVSLRLTRNADTITPEYSVDGTTFQKAGDPVTISGLAASVSVGIAVTSNKWEGNFSDTKRVPTLMQVRDFLIEKQ